MPFRWIDSFGVCDRQSRSLLYQLTPVGTVASVV